MLNFTIQPLHGIEPVAFNMDRESVHRGLKANCKVVEAAELREYYYGGEFSVFYDSGMKVQYIELSASTENTVYYNGVDVFNTPADDLVQLITRDYAFDPNDFELGYTYMFPEIELSLWRPTIPESDDDEEGRYFQTIGIGRRGYYSDSRS